MLDGQEPPLHIRVSGVKEMDTLRVYASYKDSEPSAEKNEMRWFDFKAQLVIRGDKGPKPNMRQFYASQLYLTFISSISTTIEVRPQFIDPTKANSLKYITS